MRTGVLAHAVSISSHKLQIVLYKNLAYTALLTGKKAKGKLYTKVIKAKKSFVPALPSCVKPTDIKRVSIVQNGIDGWFLASGKVFFKNARVFKRLTYDGAIYKWVDGNERRHYSNTYGSSSYAQEVPLALDLQ